MHISHVAYSFITVGLGINMHLIFADGDQSAKGGILPGAPFHSGQMFRGPEIPAGIGELEITGLL